MATFTSIFVPTGEDLTGSINATSSSAAITIGNNRIFAIVATGDVHIRIGGEGVGAASASNFLIPSGTTATYDLGDHNDSIRLYNPGGASVDYFIQYLSR